MITKSAIVIGGGGHAKVIISILKSYSNYKLLGYTDLIDKGIINDVAYLGTDDILLNQKENLNIFFGLGYGRNVQDNLRNIIIQKFLNTNFIFPPLTAHSSIICKDVILNNGVQVLNNAIINSSSIIDKFSIINTGVIIEHDVLIGKFCQIGPGAVVCGETHIASDVFIGANTTIVDSISISSNVIVGAGSVVTKNITEPGTYVGIPAKRMK